MYPIQISNYFYVFKCNTTYTYAFQRVICHSKSFGITCSPTEVFIDFEPAVAEV